MKTRLLILLSVVLVFAGVAALGALRTHSARAAVEPPAAMLAVVRAAPLREQSYTVSESFHGLIEAHASLDLAFQVPGRLAQLGDSPQRALKENDRVQPGQVLARIEPQRYEAALAQAQAQAQEAQAALAAAAARIADAEARLQDAQREAQRMAKLQQEHVANTREVEKTELALKLARAHLQSVRAQQNAAKAAHASARAAAGMAQVNLEDATLKAPFCGVIAAVPVEVGQMLAPGQSVLRLVDLTKVKLVAGVVERKLPLIRQGQRVQVHVQALQAQASLLRDTQALARPRQGVIKIVPPAADPVTGLFNVQIELDNDDDALRPGMVGKATVVVAEKRGVAIPAGAVTRSGPTAWAFFVSQGVARRISFEPILFDRDYYLISEAPEGALAIVIEGQSRLTDGQAIQVLSE